MTEQNIKKKIVVILGAGASYDSFNGNTSNIEQAWWPPLAVHLFGDYPEDERYEERKHSFLPVLAQYPGAQAVAAYLAPFYANQDFDLEAKLLEISLLPELRRHFLEVPPYLRDILASVSLEFGKQPGNYFALIAGLMAKNEHEVLFLTLNYDTLLERDLAAFKPSVYSFDKIDDYIGQSRPAKVVKVHGSSNWFRGLHALNKRQSDGSDWTSVLDNYGLQLMDESIHIAPDTATLSKDLGAKNIPSMNKGTGWPKMPVYPVLTAPLAEKSESDLVCPDPHTKFAMNFMSKCQKFLVVGTSGNDADLFSLISRSAPRPHMVHYVNADLGTAQKIAQRFEAEIENFGPGASVHTHKTGFGNYLASENFKQMVRR